MSLSNDLLQFLYFFVQGLMLIAAFTLDVSVFAFLSKDCFKKL